MKLQREFQDSDLIKSLSKMQVLKIGREVKRAKPWDGSKIVFLDSRSQTAGERSPFCAVMETSTKALVLKLQNQTGILAMLDEECLRPGTVTDDTFLEKLNQVCATHQHFESRMSKCSRFLNDTSLPHSCFRIQHYAGKVPGEGSMGCVGAGVAE